MTRLKTLIAIGLAALVMPAAASASTITFDFAGTARAYTYSSLCNNSGCTSSRSEDFDGGVVAGQLVVDAARISPGQTPAPGTSDYYGGSSPFLPFSGGMPFISASSTVTGNALFAASPVPTVNGDLVSAFYADAGSSTSMGASSTRVVAGEETPGIPYVITIEQIGIDLYPASHNGLFAALNGLPFPTGFTFAGGQVDIVHLFLTTSYDAAGEVIASLYEGQVVIGTLTSGTATFGSEGPTDAPEPAMAGLFAVGALALGLSRKRRRSAVAL